MIEADSVFAKEVSQVEVPYVATTFMGSLNVKSIIRRSYGIWMIYMKDVMCYMPNDMCYVYDVMCYMQNDMCYAWDVICCVQYDKYDDACYSHGMTFLIQIWKVH